MISPPRQNPLEKIWYDDAYWLRGNDLLLVAHNLKKYVRKQPEVPSRPLGSLGHRECPSSRRKAKPIPCWQGKCDPVTGLLNRQGFVGELRTAIELARDDRSQQALCYFDLDHFKIIVDLCSHATGEQLLQELGSFLDKQLQEIFQETVPSPMNAYVLGSLGGDKFGLLLYHCPLAQAERLSNLLLQAIERFSFHWGDLQLAVSVSIGLVAIDGSTQDWSSALSGAEAACQVAKQNGRNRTYACHQGDRELARRHRERTCLLQISQALAENRFVLYYQRIAPVGQMSAREHYEVLLRLRDETGKMISPMTFIPTAERYNLMPAIDRWVVRTFFARYEVYCQEQSARGIPPDRCLYTLNLSGASLNNDRFLEFLQEQLAQHQIPPQTICFEITETVAIANLPQVTYFVSQLKKLGCRFALDDFGSGMSSFAYLKHLPVDYLKIDGSFVKNMVRDRVDYTMVECFNHIGHAMNIETVAEFVENGAILSLLQAIGVDYAQGYGIELPCPLTFNRKF